ncbi:hypothetical protein KBA41_08975, partial [Candidatus Ozemobacteraceae bacterium]|nr:hypothetical protein [Candidatus Ozemobacteraceae bacterium]
KGRVDAHEILVGTAALPGIIRAGESQKLNGLIQMSSKEGMITMDDSLRNLVKAGTVTPEAALMKAIDKKRFEEMVEEAEQKRRAAAAAAAAAAADMNMLSGPLKKKI